MISDTCTKFMIVQKSDHFDTASTTKILNSVLSANMAFHLVSDVTRVATFRFI